MASSSSHRKPTNDDYKIFLVTKKIVPFGLVHSSSIHVYDVKGKKSLPSGKIFHRGFFFYFYDDDLCRALDYTNQTHQVVFSVIIIIFSSSSSSSFAKSRRLVMSTIVVKQS